MIVKSGIDWGGLSEFIAEKAIEKSMRDSLQDLTPEIMNSERIKGVHQGCWEVVGKLISVDLDVTEKLITNLRPAKAYMHEFDFENISDFFGSDSDASFWINRFTYESSPLNALADHNEDNMIRGKVGDKQQSAAFMDARKIGINKAIGFLDGISKTLSEDVYDLIEG